MTQALQAHAVLGVHLSHLHQVGQEWQTPDLLIQFFAQLLFVTLKLFALLGFLSQPQANSDMGFLLWLTTGKFMAITAIILNLW